MQILGTAILIFLVHFCKTQESDEFDNSDFEANKVTAPAPTEDVDIPYTSPLIDSGRVHFAEHFDDANKVANTWVKSSAKKNGVEDESISKYDGIWLVEPPVKDGLIGDRGLVLKSRAKHAAIAARLEKPFNFRENEPLLVQFEVMFQDGQECGGAYLKLLTESDTQDLALFTDKSPYTIMFGPDKCGNDHKLHFIFRHHNPRNNSLEEKHCKAPKEHFEEAFSDKHPHLYTLILSPDNTYEVLLDNKIMNSGSLLDDFNPPVNPPLEIDDPNDRKPSSWDEREKIPDPEAEKPTDWNEDAPPQIVDENAVIPDGWLLNELAHIPDVSVSKPADWDIEIDGEWEPPVIDNPACTDAIGCGKWEPPLIANPNFKGKWRAALIDNPNYQGKWRPRKISNPDYFEDRTPFNGLATIGAVGFELWSMSKDILFDNIIITSDKKAAKNWTAETFDKKRLKITKDSESFVQKIANLTNEYPALWALYIIICGIPVVLMLYLCCKPSNNSVSSQKPGTANEFLTSDHKKTDDVTEDYSCTDHTPTSRNEPPIVNDSDDENSCSDHDKKDDEKENETSTEKATSARKRKPRARVD